MEVRIWNNSIDNNGNVEYKTFPIIEIFITNNEVPTASMVSKNIENYEMERCPGSDRETDRHAGRKVGRETDRQKDRQKETQTDRQKDRQTDRQTDTERQTASQADR